MVQKIKRLKNGARAEKWKKGQSCVSNPSVTKFRDLAKQGFFQRIGELLTACMMYRYFYYFIYNNVQTKI